MQYESELHQPYLTGIEVAASLNPLSYYSFGNGNSECLLNQFFDIIGVAADKSTRFSIQAGSLFVHQTYTTSRSDL